MFAKLTIPADLAELETIREQLAQLQPRWGFTCRCSSELNLVLEELVANIVSHGNQNEEKGDIEIHLEKKTDRLEITVIDDGPGFNPTCNALPDICQPLQDRPCGGLGLLFVRRFSDSCSYRRENNRNILTLTKFLTKECSQA